MYHAMKTFTAQSLDLDKAVRDVNGQVNDWLPDHSLLTPDGMCAYTIGTTVTMQPLDHGAMYIVLMYFIGSRDLVLDLV